MKERILLISHVNKGSIQAGHNLFYPGQVDISYRKLLLKR